MHDPEIIILLPLYNGVEFIDQSVPSIQAQTYENWRLVIAVNGHPPNSPVYQRAKEFAGGRIEVLDLHRLRGKGATLNHLLDIYPERHIALMDIDDVWHPDKLARQVPHLRDHEVVSARARYIGAKGGECRVPSGEIDAVEFFFHNPVVNSSAVFINRSLRYIEPFDGVEDYVYWLCRNQRNERFYCVDQVLVDHRIHAASAFNTKRFPVNLYPLVFRHPSFPRFPSLARLIWKMRRGIGCLRP